MLSLNIDCMRCASVLTLLHRMCAYYRSIHAFMLVNPLNTSLIENLFLKFLAPILQIFSDLEFLLLEVQFPRGAESPAS